MTGKIVGNRYYVDGREVTEEVFWFTFPNRLNDSQDGPCSLSSVPEMHSEALGLNATQVETAMADAKRLGVPTDFDSYGRPIFTSRDHQRRYCQAYGFINHDENWSGRNEDIIKQQKERQQEAQRRAFEKAVG